MHLVVALVISISNEAEVRSICGMMRGRGGLGYRIDSPGSERMAAAEATQSQNGTMPQPVELQRFYAVFAACGAELARANQHWSDRCLVASDHKNCEEHHRPMRKVSPVKPHARTNSYHPVHAA